MKTSARDINIKELRVGNYLLGKQYSIDDNYAVFQVESIHPNGLNVWDGREMSILADYEWDKIKPIPITNTWLLKLGFGKGVKAPSRLSLETVFGKTLIDFNDLSKQCQYVHQLQNLYFALTGNEISAE